MIRLLWRFEGAVSHAFLGAYRGSERKRWRSLCQRFERATAGGAFVERPEVVLRCALCDGAEITIRKAAESLPASPARGGASSH